MKNLRGFTLVELIIFIAIFSISISALITVLVVVTNIQSRQTVASEVSQQSQFLLQQVQYYVQGARIIDMAQDTATSTLKLRVPVSAQDPTSITLATGTVYLQQGATGTLQALTSNKVNISQLSFARHFNIFGTSSPYGADSVSYSFTLTASTTNGTQYSQKYQSSASVLAPVGKIAIVQQAVTENNTPSVASIATAYPVNNATGSLLVAVEASQSAATTSITDTQGNAWAQKATATYPGISTMTIRLFAAVNAKNGSNTVTVTYGTNTNYPSLYIYEYRGAATASSFDASSTQNTSNTLTPSSGSVTPSAAVELIVGMDAGVNITAPSAGNGFTLETTSTANNSTQIYMEDAIRSVTGAVSSSWTFGSAVSTTALMATFK